MMGHEGHAFSADFYFDGKHVGYVRDDGNGGCICYELYKGPKGIEKEIRDYCATLYESSDDLESTIRGYSFSCADSMIDEVMTHFLEKKQYSRKAKNNTLFRIINDKGHLHEYSWSGGPYGPSAKAYLDKSYPEVKGKYPNGRLIWIYGGKLDDSFTKSEIKQAESVEDSKHAEKWNKRLAKLAKTKTIFRLKGDSENGCRTWSYGPYSEQTHAMILKAHGEKLVWIYGVGEITHGDKPRRQRGPCVL